MVLVPGPRRGKEQCRDGAGPRHVLGPDLREVDSVDSVSVDNRAGGEICAWDEGGSLQRPLLQAGRGL